MLIEIGSHTFTATLHDTATAKAFESLLPLKIKMHELNRNEKYADIPGNLHPEPICPKNIEAGDIMLYESNTLVLFYKSFSTRYTYTPIGHIHDTTGLERALGHEDVNVTFLNELQ